MINPYFAQFKRIQKKAPILACFFLFFVLLPPQTVPGFPAENVLVKVVGWDLLMDGGRGFYSKNEVL